MNKQIKMTALIFNLITGLYSAEVLAEEVSDDHTGTLIVMNSVESPVSDRFYSVASVSQEVVEKCRLAGPSRVASIIPVRSRLVAALMVHQKRRSALTCINEKANT